MVITICPSDCQTICNIHIISQSQFRPRVDGKFYCTLSKAALNKSCLETLMSFCNSHVSFWQGENAFYKIYNQDNMFCQLAVSHVTYQVSNNSILLRIGLLCRAHYDGRSNFHCNKIAASRVPSSLSQLYRQIPLHLPYSIYNAQQFIWNAIVISAVLLLFIIIPSNLFSTLHLSSVLPILSSVLHNCTINVPLLLSDGVQSLHVDGP